MLAFASVAVFLPLAVFTWGEPVTILLLWTGYEPAPDAQRRMVPQEGDVSSPICFFGQLPGCIEWVGLIRV